MRILYLNPAANLGGAERVLLDSIKAAKQYTTDDLYLVTLEDGPLLIEARRLGVKCQVCSLPRQLLAWGENSRVDQVGTRELPVRAQNNLVCQWMELGASTWPATRAILRLRKLVHKIRPQLVWSNGLKTHLLSRLVVPKDTPIVWHLHDFVSNRKLATTLLRRARNRGTYAVAVSHAVNQDWARSIPELPIRTIHNGVDTDAFRPHPSEGIGAVAKSCSELDRLSGKLFSKPTLRIGLVATYAHWKGHRVFLQAIQELSKRSDLPLAHFYIVGGPIYSTRSSQLSTAELRREIESLGLVDQVSLIDFQPGMADLYREFDVVVHASTKPEPFGLTIVEAMASGCAVVASAGGGVPEIVSPEHDSLAVQPGDWNGLALAMTRLLRDNSLRKKVSQAARHTVVSRFSQERFARDLAVLYRQRIDSKTDSIPSTWPTLTDAA